MHQLHQLRQYDNIQSYKCGFNLAFTDCKKYMKSIGVGLNVFLHFLSMLSVMYLCDGLLVTKVSEGIDGFCLSQISSMYAMIY